MPFINDLLKANEEVLYSRIESKTRFLFQVDQVMAHLRSTIFGQDHVLSHIENMLRVVKADIGEPNRPLYVALFLGPTGVGKTETVRALAQKIHGDPEHFCRIDMNTLSQEHYSAALTGAPPGYVGSREGSSLLQKEVIEGSFSKPGIVLFDELEKASPSVIQSLLNVLDNGILVMSSGEQRINFRNTMIFMTSNIGSREMRHFAKQNRRSSIQRLLLKLNPVNWGVEEDVLLKRIVDKSLEREFPPEFLNRIDEILIFQWLKQSTVHDILDSLLRQLNERLERKQCSLEVEDEVKRLLIRQGFDQRYGARALKRSVRKHLEVPVALALTSNTLSSEQTILSARFQNGEIVVNAKEGGNESWQM